MTRRILITEVTTGGTQAPQSVVIPENSTTYLRGDATFATPEGGGSFAATQTVVALPWPAKTMHRVTVTDAAVSPTSKIILSLAGVADTAENAGDDVDILSMQAVPGSGSFQFQAAFLTPIGGALTINYAIG